MKVSSSKRGKKVQPEQVKDLVAQGAKSVIEFFLGDETIRKSYVKVLLESGMTHVEICKAAHCSNATIQQVKSGNDAAVSDAMVETLRNIELDRLHQITGKVLQVMLKDGKLDDMKGGDLAYTYKTLLEARRLLENKSTANISVMIEAFTKKIAGEGQKIDVLMRDIAKKNPRLAGEEPVAQLQHSS